MDNREFYRGSPALYPRREPHVPFRAQVLFIAAIWVFGLGSMLSMMYGAPLGVLASIIVALTLAAIPFGLGWLHLHDRTGLPDENVTRGPMGPGPAQYPEAGGYVAQEGQAGSGEARRE